MPIYAAGPRPATMTLAPTSRRCIKHTLDRYLPLRSSTTKQRNSADPTPQIIARIASRPVSPDSSRAQISIAPARHRPTFPDRGFLPWRLSDAGRRCTWHRRVRPASETLHRTGLMHRGRQTNYSITSSAGTSSVGSTPEVFLYDVSEMARLSHILYDRQIAKSPDLKAPDARQSEEDRTTAGRTQGGCPIRSRIDASTNRTPPSRKYRRVERDTSNSLGRLLCWR